MPRKQEVEELKWIVAHALQVLMCEKDVERKSSDSDSEHLWLLAPSQALLSSRVCLPVYGPEGGESTNEIFFQTEGSRCYVLTERAEDHVVKRIT